MQSAYPKILLGLISVYAVQAHAAGTPANTDIINTATVSYTDPSTGAPQTVNSNPATLKVDEIIGVTLASNDAGNVTTATPGNDVPLSFTITNPGNGSEAYVLSANNALGGDQYNPTDTRIFLDDGDGIFEPGIDPAYTPGVNDPLLAPDASLVVFVTNDTPAGQANGNLGSVQLTATAVTGSGTAGTSFPGQGTGGVDAVVGTTTATSNASGTYIVSQVSTTLVKAQSVLDPFGGNNAVPGAVITYTLTLNLTGTGTIANTLIADSIPANTSYIAGSLKLNTLTLTDAADTDAGRYTGSSIEVNLGSVSAPATRSVEFKVRIN